MVKGIHIGLLSLAIAITLLALAPTALGGGAGLRPDAHPARIAAASAQDATHVFHAPVLTDLPASAFEEVPVMTPHFSATDGAGVNGVDNIGTASFLHLEQAAVCGSTCELVVGDDEIWGLAVAAGTPNFPWRWSSGFSNQGIAGGTYAQSTVWMDTNGAIYFSDPGTYYYSTTLPSTAAPNGGVIAGDMQDMDPEYCPVGQDPFIGVTGTSPNRIYYIEFWNVPHYSALSCGSARQQFEFQLYESDYHVDVVYLSNVDGFTAKAGEENNAGTAGMTYFTTSAVPDNVGIRYKDVTAPVVNAPTVTCGTAGNNGWCRSLTNTVTITDGNDVSTVQGLGVKTRTRLLDGASNGAYTSGAAASVTSTNGLHTVAGQAVDLAGNTGTSSATSNLKIDTVAPTLSLAQTGCSIAGNNGWCRGTITVSASATDATSGVSTTSCTRDGSAIACGTISVTGDSASHSVCVSATDVAGNSASQQCLSGLKIDATAPALSGSRSPAANGFGWNNVAVTASWSCSDATSGVASAPSPVTRASEGASQSASGTCTDNAGNSGSNTVSGINIDLTGPSLTGSRSPAANAAGWNKQSVTASWACNDALSGIATPPASVTLSSEGAGQSAAGSCTDKAGNGASNTVSGINIDKTAPVIDAPSDVTAEATGADGATVAYATPDAHDALSGAGPVTCAPASGATFPLGDTSVACDASDAAGNAAATTSFLVSVLDRTPPTIDAHADIDAEAVDANGAIVSYASPATFDLVDGEGVASCAPASDTLFPLGATTVACDAIDAAGNAAATTTFVVRVGDATAPIIDAVADVTAEATGAAGAIVVYDAPATHDAVDGTGVASCAPASGSLFALGDTSVSCVATDAAGNDAAPVFFYVHVVDTTAPTIDAGVDVTFEATSPAGAIATYDAPATHDIVDGDSVADCSPASGSEFALGDTDVACASTDGHGNIATPVTFQVHIVDTTAPIVTVPDDLTVEATGPDGAAADFAASATDLVDGFLDATCAPTSGSTFALATTPVACAATDAAGNTGGAGFSVTVVDTTPPLIDAASDLFVEATSAAGATVNYDAPATSDLVDGAGIATCAPATGSTFGVGRTTVTCIASDARGNAADATQFVVSVLDSSNPVIDAHDDVLAEATSAAGASVPYASPLTRDAVDGQGVASCTPASGSLFALGTSRVSCTAQDAHGNTASPTSFAITVVDTSAPTIAAHDDLTVEAADASGALVDYDAPPTSDAVDGAGAATCAPTTGSLFALGDTTVTCDATDTYGNAATTSTFTIHVVDTQAPLLSVTASGERGSAGWFVSTANVAIACSDNAAGVSSLTFSLNGAADAPYLTAIPVATEGVNSVIARCTDASGNEAVEELAVKIDTQGPTGTLSAPLASAGAFEVAWSASDAAPGSGLAMIEIQERSLFGALGDAWATVCSQPLAGGPSGAEGTCQRDPAPGQYCYRIVVRDVAGNEFTGLASDLPDLGGALADLTTTCTLKGTPGQLVVAIADAAPRVTKS